MSLSIINEWMILGFAPPVPPQSNLFTIGTWGDSQPPSYQPNYDLKALVMYSAYDTTTDGIVTAYLGAKYHIALIAAPDAPTCTPSHNAVTLTWPAVSGAATYNVYSSGTLLASGITDAMRAAGWTDTTQTDGNIYSYTVTAIDATTGGETAQSAATTGTVQYAPYVVTSCIIVNSGANPSGPALPNDTLYGDGSNGSTAAVFAAYPALSSTTYEWQQTILTGYLGYYAVQSGDAGHNISLHTTATNALGSITDYSSNSITVAS